MVRSAVRLCVTIQSLAVPTYVWLRTSADSQTRCGVAPFQLLLRAAETSQHSDGHVGDASTSRVVLTSSPAFVDEYIALAASYVAPAPVAEYIAPAESFVAPASVVENLSPAVSCTAPSPDVEYLAPAESYTAPALVVEYISPAPVGYAAPPPDHIAPVRYAAPAPVGEKNLACARMNTMRLRLQRTQCMPLRHRSLRRSLHLPQCLTLLSTWRLCLRGTQHLHRVSNTWPWRQSWAQHQYPSLKTSQRFRVPLS